MYSSYSSSTATDMDNQKHSADPPQLRSGNPPVQTPPPGTEAPWSTGLFSCFDDVPNCCITCWCPCITFGQIAEIADEGAISWGASAAIYTLIGIFTGCACCYSCFYRMKLRKQYRLSESPCADCCVHWFCESCALCQEYRELKNRGFDMSEGCVTCYLPCVTFGQIAEIVDKGETSCCKAGAIHSLIPCGLRLLVEPCCLGSYRTKLRQQYSLPEAPCNDCLISCFCERCALCQHYRELKKQGFDMSAGWEGNLAKKRGEMAVPLAEGGMTRDK